MFKQSIYESVMDKYFKQGDRIKERVSKNGYVKQINLSITVDRDVFIWCETLSSENKGDKFLLEKLLKSKNKDLTIQEFASKARQRQKFYVGWFQNVYKDADIKFDTYIRKRKFVVPK